jgi:hypothetical protein
MRWVAGLGGSLRVWNPGVLVFNPFASALDFQGSDLWKRVK